MGGMKPTLINTIASVLLKLLPWIPLSRESPEKWRLIRAHGTTLGLQTEDDMGNSEVGHNALGAGRIYAQGAKLVDLALASGKIFEGEGFKYISVSFSKGTLHFIGLLSDGGIISCSCC